MITDALKTAKTFEIHCRNEEPDEIAPALQYGILNESDRAYGKIITGKVTPEFAEKLLYVTGSSVAVIVPKPL